MLEYIKERLQDYNANFFLNEIVDASKNLGILEAKINAYKFNSILIPMLHTREALSSMYIEGTQATISDVYENTVMPKESNAAMMCEVNNHTKALIFGAEHLRIESFTHTFICKLHQIMLDGILANNKYLGKYKPIDNRIENSAGTVVFVPPSHLETKKYMTELIEFMNNSSDGIHPLIKAGIIHSQFESIHPFLDGNGRVGRLLVSLYLFKSKVINFPFFYISEAISQDKSVYYNMLTKSRQGTYDEWLKYFLKKICIQTQNHIGYIDSLNDLYEETKKSVQKCINSPRYDAIIECLFTQPILTANYLEEKLSISHGQAVRYLNTLCVQGILLGDDRKRGRKFYFGALMDLAGRL